MPAMATKAKGKALTAAQKKAAAQKSRRFTPYALIRPPSDKFDPGLDAQARAATRGLSDTRLDTEKNLERGSDDYLLARGNTTADYNTALGNLQRTTGYSLADILKQQTREGQDYGTAVGNLQRQYGIAGRNMVSASNAANPWAADAGVMANGRGILAGNQQREQQVLDLAHARSGEDTSTAQQRVQDELGASTKQLTTTKDRGLGQLDLGYHRATEDAGTALARAVRENRNFQTDTQTARVFEAKQAGWVPPTKPKNELTRNGVTYHQLPHNRYVLPSGRMVGRPAILRVIKAGKVPKGW